MHSGGAMFFTDYSMSAPELARALEERGFESVWAPEQAAENELISDNLQLHRRCPRRHH